FITTAQGRGTFVAEHNVELIREQQLRIVEEHLEKAAAAARQAGLSLKDMIAVLELFYQEGGS
ncbi:MAG: GntR family transcriptional regulator, partial [Limnochordia bacterium]